MRHSTREPRAASYAWGCALLSLLHGCAINGTVVEDAARNAAPIYQGPETPTMYAEAPRSVTGSMARPVNVVRAAVRQTLVDYSIPVTLDTAATGQIGNADFCRSRGALAA